MRLRRLPRCRFATTLSVAAHRRFQPRTVLLCPKPALPGGCYSSGSFVTRARHRTDEWHRSGARARAGALGCQNGLSPVATAMYSDVVHGGRLRLYMHANTPSRPTCKHQPYQAVRKVFSPAGHSGKNCSFTQKHKERLRACASQASPT